MKNKKLTFDDGLAFMMMAVGEKNHFLNIDLSIRRYW